MIVSREVIRTFAELTGDDAPIHRDAVFAKRSGFAAPIGQGLLIASFAQATLAQCGPGERDGSFEVRFQRPVVTDDRLECRLTTEEGGATAFEVVNQRGEIAARGRMGTCAKSPSRTTPHATGPRDSTPPDIWFAEDVMEHFEPGEASIGQLDRSAVERFGALFDDGGEVLTSTFPAALLFARGFACFLGALLECPLPAAGSAGHLGDRWRLYRAPQSHEAVRVRYQAASLTRSRSQPDMAIVDFAIDFYVEAERILGGEAVIMVPARPPEHA